VLIKRLEKSTPIQAVLKTIIQTLNHLIDSIPFIQLELTINEQLTNVLITYFGNKTAGFREKQSAYQKVILTFQEIRDIILAPDFGERTGYQDRVILELLNVQHGPDGRRMASLI
jgi:hypothetical protein